MIKNYLIKGDCHGFFGWMQNLSDYAPSETAIIILGDAGINFWLNQKDIRLKKELESRGYTLYCVRGNHEARPQHVPGMDLVYDEVVQGEVYFEYDYPHIRYFKDYGIYTINNYRVGVIGGAYSVDKWYRLARAGIQNSSDPAYYNPKITGWFAQEQLSQSEMDEAAALFRGQTIDFMFSHTCPYDWRPTDLFLSSIDQSTVDSTMEKWMQEVRDSMVSWGIWCFGHYHMDRLERPRVEQYYNDIESLDVIAERWELYDRKNEIYWWLKKSPFFN